MNFLDFLISSVMSFIADLSVISTILKSSFISFDSKTELVPLPSLSLNLSINLLNLNSLNVDNTSLLFHSTSLRSDIFSSSGTSKLIVPSVLESIAKSLFSTNFSFNLP